MDFASPDVMKDFPGLFGSDLHKAKGTDNECKYFITFY